MGFRTSGDVKVRRLGGLGLGYHIDARWLLELRRVRVLYSILYAELRLCARVRSRGTVNHSHGARGKERQARASRRGSPRSQSDPAMTLSMRRRAQRSPVLGA